MSIAKQFQIKTAAKADAPKTPAMVKPKPVAPPTKTETIVQSTKGKGGRPKTGSAKEQVSLRLDPRVLAHYRASGEGWQSRLNADLVRLCGL